MWKQFLVGRERWHVSEIQPLTSEVLHERVRPRIFDHAADLRVEVGAELAVVGEAEEFVVGHCAPEEVREAGGEFVILKWADLRVVGALFGAEEELGRDEDGFEGEFEALFKGVAAFGGTAIAFEGDVRLLSTGEAMAAANVDQNDDGYKDGVLQNTIGIMDPTTESYALFQGTSMATPHAAGAFAVLSAARPGATLDELASRFTASGTAVTGDSYGKPRIEVWRALGIDAFAQALSMIETNYVDPVDEQALHPHRGRVVLRRAEHDAAVEADRLGVEVGVGRRVGVDDRHAAHLGSALDTRVPANGHEAAPFAPDQAARQAACAPGRAWRACLFCSYFEFVKKCLTGSPIFRHFSAKPLELDKDEKISLTCKDKFIGCYRVTLEGEVLAVPEFVFN